MKTILSSYINDTMYVEEHVSKNLMDRSRVNKLFFEGT